jgi:phospholipid-binding lipoprotein MlaA
MRSFLIDLAGLAAAVLLAPAHALAASSAASPDRDPWEHVNRGLYRFNDGLDRAVLRPAARGYKKAVARPVRTGVRNALNNINEPNTLMNDLLQGRVVHGGQSAARFVINSTVGIAGLFDVATPIGIPAHDADFGQTLGRWGLPAGPYIFVPVFGPTDLRDGTGRIVDGFASILSLHDLHVTTAARVGVTVVDGVDSRLALDSTIEAVKHTATDPYATTRSAYLQNRRSMVINDKQAIDQLPSFDAPPPTSSPAKPARRPTGSN